MDKLNSLKYSVCSVINANEDEQFVQWLGGMQSYWKTWAHSFIGNKSVFNGHTLWKAILSSTEHTNRVQHHLPATQSSAFQTAQ